MHQTPIASLPDTATAIASNINELLGKMQVQAFLALPADHQQNLIQKCDRLLKSDLCNRSTKGQLASYLEVLSKCGKLDPVVQEECDRALGEWQNPKF